MRLTKIRASPRYYVEYREGGEKKRVSTGTADPQEAERFLAEFRLAYATEQAAGWPTIAAVLAFYYDDRASKLASAQQADIAVKKLSRFYGSARVDALGMAKQRLYVQMREEQGVSDETIRREQSVLSAALNWAHKWEKLPGPPPKVHMPPEAEPRERALSRDEAAKLLRHLHRNRRQRHVLLFARLALATGQRSGAILGLTWDRVDFDAGVIRFIKPGVRRTNKRAVNVPMTPPIRRMLEHAQFKARRKPGHVITWGGKQVTRIIKAFRANAEEVGLEDVTPHTLRHTFGTWAAGGGADLLQLGRAMGHTRVKTTERYIKTQTEGLRSVLNAARRGKSGASGRPDRRKEAPPDSGAN